MRIVPAARPVRSATSLMARSCPRSHAPQVEGSTRCGGVPLHDGPGTARRGGGVIPAPSRRVRLPRWPTILLTGRHRLRRRPPPPRAARRRPRRPLPRARPARGPQLPDGVEVVRGDVLRGRGLADALAGVDVAYYLVHSMGSGGGDFAERDRRAADTFGDAARAGRRRADRLPRRPGGPPDARAPAQPPRGRRGPAPATSPARSTSARRWSSAGAPRRSRCCAHLVERLPLMITPALDRHAHPARRRPRRRRGAGRAGRPRRRARTRCSSAAPTC